VSSLYYNFEFKGENKMDTINEKVENLNEETKEVEETQDVEEIKKLNESTFNIAMEKLNSYGLNWTFRSINYVLNTCNVSFGQLRSCIYIKDGQGYFDYIKSTMYLIQAGLVGSGQFKENEAKKIEDRAYEIIEDWRETFGFIGTLHLLLIHEMETKHFFMGTADQAVMNHLSSKNLQNDLVRNLHLEDLEEKVKQAQALSTTL
jgi:hypothetical protein